MKRVLTVLVCLVSGARARAAAPAMQGAPAASRPSAARPSVRSAFAGDYGEELREAERWFRSGRRERARNIWEEVLDAAEEEPAEDRPSKAERALALFGLARFLRVTGAYGEALGRIDEGRRLTPFVEFDLEEARIRLRTGGFERARTLLLGLWRPGTPEPVSLAAGALLAAGLEARGRDEEARKIRAAIVETGKRRALEDPQALLAYAEALIGLGGGERLQEASRILIEATRKDPKLARAYVVRGWLLYEVYKEARGFPSAESEFKRALRECGEVEEALVGLFLTRKDNFLLDYGKTLSYLERALALNPHSVPALRAKAARRIDDRAFEAGRRLLLKALAVDPDDRRTLAELAAVAELLGRPEEAKRYRARARALEGGRPVTDLVLGRHLIALYRFRDAVPVLERAKRRAPEDPDVLLALGKALIYAGHGDEGAEVLREIRRLRPGFVDPWRENQLMLHERLAKEYRTYDRGNFVFVLHPSEAGVLLPYLSRTYAEAWKELGTKYGVFPDCKIRVEDFERFGDFSVRTIGYQGFGALGACFGCFITSVSPAAPELRRQFSWRVTAFHEFSHVLHIQLSKARVPRWLTEGLAVYEEIALDRSYDRRMERRLYDAWRNGGVLPVARLNTAFRGGDILFGYYQGGLVVRHIARDYGFPKLVEMLKAYGRDESTEQIFREVLGVRLEEYDRRFLAYVRELVGHLKLTPRIGEAWLERLLRRIASHPSDVEARLLAGHAFRQRGAEVDAGVQVAALQKLVPGDPRLLLLRGMLALGRGDLGRARKLLGRAFDGGAQDFDGWMAYARLLEKAGRKEEALAAYESAIGCWPTCPTPGPGSPFLARARLLDALGRRDEAARARERYLGLNGRDYEARMALAAYYRRKGDAKRELQHLEKARDVDPFDRRLHFRLAELHEKAGLIERAIRDLEICLATPPEKDRSRRRGARAGAGAADVGKGDAERLFEAKARIFLGELLLRAGDRKGARAQARRALDLGAALPAAWEKRARRLL